MLATINESLFPIFLFLLYFCAISVTLTRRSNESGAIESMKETPSAPDSEIEIDAPTIDREIEPVPDEESRESEREDDFLVQTEVLIDKLTKRSDPKNLQAPRYPTNPRQKGKAANFCQSRDPRTLPQEPGESPIDYRGESSRTSARTRR